ncbi:hypothetical protein DL96DRAFT_1478853 [Flagelloscypha sp. PMI_526]|nr:hypothetical protein DL96DRAFT_1478853 [Flagelloscypha sp. PMI_526]
MDIDSHPDTSYKVSGLWLEDGSLVIKAGNRLFKIHRSTLATQSPVFADMISFPPSQDQEFLDGCPLVELPDDPEAVEFFLRAVTLPDFFLPPPAATHYHVVAGVLRMAHKYECSAFRHRALQHLSIRFSTTLVDYTHRNYISKPIFRGYGDSEKIAYNLDFISLLYETEALWCLPLQYQGILSWIPRSLMSIINGIDFKSRHYGITSDQQVALIAGKENFRQQVITSMNAFSSAAPECTQNGCQQPRRKLLAAFIKLNPSKLSNPWLKCWFDLENPTVYTFCQPCRDKAKQDYQNLRQTAWDRLPQAFGLPSWDELNEMKKKAVGHGIGFWNKLFVSHSRTSSAFDWKAPFRPRALTPDVICSYLILPLANVHFCVKKFLKNVRSDHTTHIMDIDSQPDSPHQVPDLWLEDGNLVIKAGNRIFRVHRSTLAAQSSVFADMLSFPPSPNQEIFDGCPLVEVPDDPASIEFFLRAVTQPDFFLPPPAEAHYHVIAGILRISHKYDCSIFRSRALRHLSIRCSTTLNDYTHRDYISNSIFGSYNSFEERAYGLDFVSLIYEVGALWCLPVHYRTLTTWIPESLAAILDGIEFQSRHYKITSDQQITMISGKEFLRRELTALMKTIHSPSPDCAQNGCQRAHKVLLATFIRLSPSIASNPWFSRWFDLENSTVYPFCMLCREKAKQDFQNLRQESWNRLPQVFGLPSWDELNQMKKNAIGHGTGSIYIQIHPLIVVSQSTSIQDLNV